MGVQQVASEEENSGRHLAVVFRSYSVDVLVKAGEGLIRHILDLWMLSGKAP